MTHLARQGQGTLRKPRLFLKTILSASFLSLTLIGVASVLPLSSAVAQDDSRQFSAKAGEHVNEALALAAEEKFDTANTLLNSLLRQSDLTAYERSTLYQMLGQYKYELDDFLGAQDAFQNAIQADGLLPKEIDSVNLTLAQLMIGNGQYREGAVRLETHLKSTAQDKSKYVEMLMQAWLQAGEYSRALPWAERWFINASPKERKHYDLMNFLYNNLGQTDKQIDIIKQMINHWPEDKSLWGIWTSILANGGREEDAFEVQKMFYLGGGMSDEPSLLKVVQYYSFYDTPYQAAEILDREIKQKRISRTPETLIQLSDLYRQAREYHRAIPILEEVAKQTDKAKPFADWGEALHNQGDCEGSEEAFIEAIDRGYDAGKSWMLIANCRYDETAELDRLRCEMTHEELKRAPITKARQHSLEAFRNVPASSREYRNAQTWIEFISGERKAFDRRCDFQIQTVEASCVAEIQRAYDAIFLIGEFKLDNPDICLAYKDEYDAKFRSGQVKSQPL